MPLTKDVQDSPLEALNEITNEIAEAGNRATANQLQEIGFELESRLQSVEEERDRLERALRRCVDALEETHDGKRYAAGRAALDLLADLESKD